jgi:hypothetical protein
MGSSRKRAGGNKARNTPAIAKMTADLETPKHEFTTTSFSGVYWLGHAMKAGFCMAMKAADRTRSGPPQRSLDPIFCMRT